MHKGLLAIFLLLWTALPGAAQDTRVWIQIAARQTRDEALSYLQAESRRLDGLKGLRMRSGWYAAALGPFMPATGQSEIARLRAQGRIPQDSYLARRDTYRRQFWPPGQSSLWRSAALASRQPGPMSVPVPDAGAIDETPLPPDAAADAVAPDPAQAAGNAATLTTGIGTPASLDETPAEARASERLLDKPARESLQRALAWFGFYNAAIDGDIGPGTRKAMADWQASQGYDTTGILTARERAEILAAFQDDIAALGLEPVTREDAGITIDLPKGVVTYDGTDAPFVRYKGDGADPARVVLISEAGDQDRLVALYRVIQTLAIVPEGSRARLRGGGFTIDGETGTATTHIEAALYGQTIKGFALVWPRSAPGDAGRVAEAMAAGFEALDGKVLPDDAGNSADQNVDLMAGLEIRRADWTRSGVYVDAQGKAVTLASGLGACGKLTIGEDLPATATMLGDSGLALVTPLTPAAPMATATFREAPGRIGSEVTLALYPLGGRVDAPSTTFATLSDIKSPAGDAAGMRLTVPGPLHDTGGPILDDTGTVLGLVAPPDENGMTPPADVARGIGSAAIAAALRAGGIEPSEAPAIDHMMPREEVAKAASEITALVSCWR